MTQNFYIFYWEENSESYITKSHTMKISLQNVILCIMAPGKLCHKSIVKEHLNIIDSKQHTTHQKKSITLKKRG